MIDEMVNAVNQLRLDYGLSALRVNPLLMQIAQAQADYNAAIGSSTHYGPDGSRPFQRALAVGYPVAGDLSLGGWFSENIINGPITSQAAVMMWTGDDPHLNTMISVHRSDMGVGIATEGDTYYFVLDTGLYSQYEIEWTPSAPGVVINDETLTGQVGLGAALVTASTPLPDGSLLHVVSPGQSLWTIAAVYHLTLDQLYLLNNLKPNQFIYPGDKLWIRTAEPPTPTVTATYKPPPTARPSATLTLEPSPSPSSTTTPTRRPTSVIPALNSSNKDSFILVVVICSLIVVGVFYWIFRKATIPMKDES
jgi:LysM repeat protein